MNLLFVVPDKEKDLGNLEFGGPEQASRDIPRFPVLKGSR